MPTVSIITVNLNNREGLERTLKSVDAQSTKPHQYVVVDGLSTDGSRDLIAAHNDLIDLAIEEGDSGVYDAMNKAISKATGEYLYFLNSGDHFVSDTALSHATEALTGEELICFDIAMTGQGHDYVKAHPDELHLSYMLTDTLAHQAVFIKRILFDRLGLYDTSLKIVADWKFFLDALLLPGTRYKAVHTLITQYYLDGMSATAAGTFKRREERKQLLSGHFAFLKEAQQENLLLQTNRFKALHALETSKTAQKLNSFWLRGLLCLFKNKSVDQL